MNIIEQLLVGVFSVLWLTFVFVIIFNRYKPATGETAELQQLGNMLRLVVIGLIAYCLFQGGLTGEALSSIIELIVLEE